MAKKASSLVFTTNGDRLVKRTNSTSKLLRWQKARYSPLARQIDVFSLVARLVFYLWWDNSFGNNSPKQRNRRAQWLVRQLLNLGPTFIKIGQALSTRPDLIPIEYIEALTQLQDRVPEFSSAEAIATVESELGSSVNSLYLDFDPVPLASASIGQVHRAKLHSGEEVVVKVQRPGIEELFNLDFEVLHRLIRFSNQYLPWVRKYDLEGIYQEFFSLLYQEIDYFQEGKNAERFQENFQNYPGVIVPKVYWRYTTKKVLTLEYLPGIKISDRATIEAAGINPDRLIELGICCYLKQLLEDGFFQSDPHPGNMAVAADGSIIFYDFGTMAEVKSLAKDEMVKTFFAVIRKDADRVVDSLVYMGLLEPMSDMTAVKRLVAFLLDNFRDKPVDIRAFEQVSAEVYMMFEQQPFRLPPQMTFVLKSLTTLDGIARALDPQYNLLQASKPFITRIAASSATSGNFIGQLARQAKSYLQNRLQKSKQTEILLQRIETRLEQGEFQMNVRNEASDRALGRIHLALKCLIYACLFGFGSLCGSLLVLVPALNWAIAVFAFAAFWFLLFLRSFVKLAIRERLDRLAQK
ncbi:MAG: AarF/ABC1/UbiB kinase family protein [Oscillatoria sp. PMC 1051.18]|nr:AarF/ABC1/UbiB kinase family protein [Oscillatoria sp. PMC 1051.18]